MEPSVPPTASPSETEVLIVLSERRSRRTVRILQDSPSPLSVMEVARRIATHEYDSPPAPEVEAINRSLQTTHLPRLEDAGVLEYDADEGAIHPGVNFDAIMDFLANVDRTDLPWADQ